MDSAFPGSMAQYYWLVKRRRNAAFAAGNTNRLLAPTCGHRTAQSTRPQPPAASTCPPRRTPTDSAVAAAAAGRPPRSSATAAASAAASAWRTVSAARARRAREAEPPLSLLSRNWMRERYIIFKFPAITLHSTWSLEPCRDRCARWPRRPRSCCRPPPPPRWPCCAYPQRPTAASALTSWLSLSLAGPSLPPENVRKVNSYSQLGFSNKSLTNNLKF